MIGLDQLVGHEHRLDEVARALRLHAQSYRAPVIGAVHVTCVDESEHECADAFNHGVVADLLPALKFSRKSCFRVATAGGRYEWGGVRVAEQHFALKSTRASFKVMVVKINAHVSLEEDRDGPRFGYLQRYQEDSTYCGALHLLLEGRMNVPFLQDLAETFASEDLDRVALLNDPGQVPAPLRHLYAAIVEARLQARRAILDIQDYTPASPTLYLVVPCVTLNRPELDTELLCGLYLADHRGPERQVTYQGLGDDPRTYQLEYRHRHITVRGETGDAPRDARDHRTLLQATIPAPPPHAMGHNWHDLADRIRQGVPNEHARAALKSALVMLGELAPIPTALVLFSSGAAGMYHVYRAHRLAAQGTVDDGRILIADVQKRLDHLPPDQAQTTLAALAEHFGGNAQAGTGRPET